MTTSNWRERMREEFYERFGHLGWVVPERFLEPIADWWLSKFDTLISEIEEEIKKDLANFGVKLAQNTDNTIDEFTVATQIGLIGEISPRISNILKDYKQDNNK